MSKELGGMAKLMAKGLTYDRGLGLKAARAIRFGRTCGYAKSPFVCHKKSVTGDPSAQRFLNADSTRRRMASGRVGRSSCCRRQSSSFDSVSASIRTVTGALSTLGRPRILFLTLSILDMVVL